MVFLTDTPRSKQNFIHTIINFDSRNYLPLPTGESTPAAESTRQNYWSPPHHLAISTLKKSKLRLAYVVVVHSHTSTTV